MNKEQFPSEQVQEKTPRPSKFQVHKDEKGDLRARFVSGNGKVLFTTEGYTERRGVTVAIEILKKEAADAEIEFLD